MVTGPVAVAGEGRGKMPGRESHGWGTGVVVAVLGMALVASCADDEQWDGVVMLTYRGRALEGHVKRRIGLLTAGVPLRGELAADTVWTDVLGHTFIGRRTDREAGIRSVRTRRLGVSLRRRGPGIERTGSGHHRLQEGYTITDVFSPMNRYLGSAVAAEGMTGRRILQHMGVTRRHSATVDRMYLGNEQVTGWRELLPVVIQNRGFGYLYTRSGREGAGGDEEASGDSLEVMAQRYEIEQVEGFALVGKDRSGESYRHVFAPGGEYRVTAIQHGRSHLDGSALLGHLGLLTARDSGQ